MIETQKKKWSWALSIFSLKKKISVSGHSFEWHVLLSLLGSPILKVSGSAELLSCWGRTLFILWVPEGQHHKAQTFQMPHCTFLDAISRCLMLYLPFIHLAWSSQSLFSIFSLYFSTFSLCLLFFLNFQTEATEREAVIQFLSHILC